MLHEFLERAFGEARPFRSVNEGCTGFAGGERATAVREHQQSVQFEVPARINLDSRTLVAKVTGVPAHRDERRSRRSPVPRTVFYFATAPPRHHVQPTRSVGYSR